MNNAEFCGKGRIICLMDKWQEIYSALADAGIDVYAPGGHCGICRTPYCVVQTTGGYVSGEGNRCGRSEYRIYLVVPAESPSEIERLAAGVRTALANMLGSGSLESVQPRGATVPDDDFQALISYMDFVSYYSDFR